MTHDYDVYWRDGTLPEPASDTHITTIRLDGQPRTECVRQVLSLENRLPAPSIIILFVFQSDHP